MSKKEYYILADKVLQKMREKYPSMNMGDLQSVAMFSELLKQELEKEGIIST